MLQAERQKARADQFDHIKLKKRRVKSMTRNAIKLRNVRARARAGTEIYRLELDVVAMEEMLVREKLLSPGQEHTREQVAGALITLLTTLANLKF